MKRILFKLRPDPHTGEMVKVVRNRMVPVIIVPAVAASAIALVLLPGSVLVQAAIACVRRRTRGD